jgi:hypothetical protein
VKRVHADERANMPFVESAGEPISLELTDDERAVLRAGLVEWGGPARATQELAFAMGFRDQTDLFSQGDRIIKQLKRREPFDPLRLGSHRSGDRDRCRQRPRWLRS